MIGHLPNCTSVNLKTARYISVSVTMVSLCLHSKWLQKFKKLKEKFRKLQIVLILLSGFSIYFLIGSIYTFGNIQPYLVSYVRKKSHPSDLRYTESTFLFSSQYAVYGLGVAVGSLTEKKLGIRLSLIIGGIMSSSGLLLSFIFVRFSFWLLVISFGAMYSVGIGMVYAPTLICTMKWVPNKTGIAVGLVMSGVGVSSLMFSAIQTGLINTFDKFPDESPYEDKTNEKYFSQRDIITKMPFVFLVECIIFIIVFLFSAIFLTEPPTNTTSTEKQDKLKVKDAIILNICSTLQHLKVMLSMVDFYLLCTAQGLSTFNFGIILSLVKTYGIEVLTMSDYCLTALEMTCGICNSLGRFLFGYLSDLIGYKLALVINNGIFAVFLLTLPITSFGLPVMYFIWICGITMCYGGFSTLSNIAILKRFGIDHFNINFPLIATTSMVVGSILIGMLSYYLIGYFGWPVTFLFLGSCSIVQFSCILFFSEGKKHN